MAFPVHPCLRGERNPHVTSQARGKAREHRLLPEGTRVLLVLLVPSLPELPGALCSRVICPFPNERETGCPHTFAFHPREIRRVVPLV